LSKKLAMANKKQMLPRISIGMPVFNGEDYIRDAIESLLSQSVGDFELIISDNASTDFTEVICKAYAAKDDRVRYIRQNINIGAAANYIYVLKAAQCEYFMWAACDDTWSSNWLETLLPGIKSEDVGIFSGYREGGGEVIHPKNYPRGSHFEFFLDSDLTGKCLYSYALFKRELLLQSEMNLLYCPMGADQLYLHHLLSKGSLSCVMGGVINYRVHDSSLSADQRRSRSLFRRLLSRFPFVYYKMAFLTVPHKLKLLMLLVISLKYIKVQSFLVLGMAKSLSRRIEVLVRK
jgi:glycosyltransferase involved in cell wall biosynthesis